MSDIDKTFDATIHEVHSGDDLIAFVSLGVDNLYKRTRLRLKGVDTPDAYRAKDGTVAGEVRDMVRDMVEGKECIIVRHRETKGGWVGTLYVEKLYPKQSINDLLIEDGYVFKEEGSRGDS